MYHFLSKKLNTWGIVNTLMIPHIRSVERLDVKSKPTPNKKKALTRRQQKQITFKFDVELSNQLDFLAQSWEIKKLEVLRKLVKTELENLGLWKKYERAPKRYSEKELLTVKN